MQEATISTEQRAFYHMTFSGLSLTTADCDTLSHALQKQLQARQSGNSDETHCRLVTYLNPHVYNLAVEHTELRECLVQADFICIDGVGVKLAVWLRQRQWLPRTVAEHLFNHFVQTLQHPTQCLLIGATADEVNAAAQALEHAQPHLQVVDTLNGYASDSDCEAFLRQHATVPLILIGAGSPKSERMALAAIRLCNDSVVFHIGAGTLKTWAGTKRVGPLWLHRMGLQWLHRCLFEPHTRQRYVLGGLRFMRYVLSGRQHLLPDYNFVKTAEPDNREH